MKKHQHYFGKADLNFGKPDIVMFALHDQNSEHAVLQRREVTVQVRHGRGA